MTPEELLAVARLVARRGGEHREDDAMVVVCKLLEEGVTSREEAILRGGTIARNERAKRARPQAVLPPGDLLGSLLYVEEPEAGSEGLLEDLPRVFRTRAAVAKWRTPSATRTLLCNLVKRGLLRRVGYGWYEKVAT